MRRCINRVYFASNLRGEIAEECPVSVTLFFLRVLMVGFGPRKLKGRCK